MPLGWDVISQAMLDAINDNDFLWRPVVRVQLQRQAGMWSPNSKRYVRDQATSYIMLYNQLSEYLWCFIILEFTSYQLNVDLHFRIAARRWACVTFSTAPWRWKIRMSQCVQFGGSVDLSCRMGCCLDPISNLLGVGSETFQKLAMPFSLVSGCFSTACPGHDRFDEKGTKVTSNHFNILQSLQISSDQTCWMQLKCWKWQMICTYSDNLRHNPSISFDLCLECSWTLQSQQLLCIGLLPLARASCSLTFTPAQKRASLSLEIGLLVAKRTDAAKLEIYPIYIDRSAGRYICIQVSKICWYICTFACFTCCCTQDTNVDTQLVISWESKSSRLMPGYLVVPV